ncbi:MAG: AAA family ATPase [Candidatus Sumerlaeia bacterium]|nr:AAA family ATPase [Candidatus Sumerlaeia bacterium]
MERLSRFVINNYRKFPRLVLPRLGKLNVFLGENGSGKSTALDAIEAAHLNPPLGLSGIRRGEFRKLTSNNRDHQVEYQMAPMFYGHSVKLGSTFGFEAYYLNESKLTASAQILDGIERGNGKIPPNLSTHHKFVLTTRMDGDPEGYTREFPISSDGSVPEGTYKPSPVLGSIKDNRLNTRGALHLGGVGSDQLPVSEMWDDIVLTPHYDRLLELLNIVHPGIREVAAKGFTPGRDVYFAAKLDGVDKPVPIGSLGHGVSCIFNLALGLANSEFDIFLVDELETGLHYSILPKIWEMLLKATDEGDTQIFVTTHSRDCLNALAQLQKSNSGILKDTLIHTLRQGREDTVIYEPGELPTIVDSGLEVRQ